LRNSEAAILEHGRAIVVARDRTRDEVVDSLEVAVLLQTTMKHRRNADACLLPQLEGLLVVAVERLERGLQFDRQAERIKRLALPRPFLGIFLPICSHRLRNFGHLAAGDVVGDRHARQLDDAAFDGIHQREVAHRPGEQRAFGVA
jgi:hypothetical protein